MASRSWAEAADGGVGVERGERAQVLLEVGTVGAGVGAERLQDAVGLAADGRLGLADLVVEVEHGGGLDVEPSGRSRSRRARSPGLCAWPRRGRGSRRARRGAWAAPRWRSPRRWRRGVPSGAWRGADPWRSASSRWSRRSSGEASSRNRAPGGVQRAPDVVFEVFQLHQMAGHAPQRGRPFLARAEVGEHPARRAGKAADGEQLVAVEARVFSARGGRGRGADRPRRETGAGRRPRRAPASRRRGPAHAARAPGPPTAGAGRRARRRACCG